MPETEEEEEELEWRIRRQLIKKCLAWERQKHSIPLGKEQALQCTCSAYRALT